MARIQYGNTWWGQKWLEALQFSYKPLFFHGSLQQKKRNEIVDSFQHDAESRFLIISLKAGGTGLNLTAANNVIHYDL